MEIPPVPRPCRHGRTVRDFAGTCKRQVCDYNTPVTQHNYWLVDRVTTHIASNHIETPVVERKSEPRPQAQPRTGGVRVVFHGRISLWRKQTHADIVCGGELVFEMTDKPGRP